MLPSESNPAPGDGMPTHTGRGLPGEPPVVGTRRGSPAALLAAWLVIIACASYAMWEANAGLFASQQATGSAPSTQPAADQRLAAPMEAAARVIAGLGEWVSPDMRSMVLTQAAMLQAEGPKERMVYAILAADLVGLQEANAELDALLKSDGAAPPALSVTDQRLLGILKGLYAVDERERIATLSDDDRTFLEAHLGWFGRFAPLARGVAGESPQRTAMIQSVKRGPIVMVAFMLWLVVCAVIGFIALIVLLIMAVNRRLQHGFGRPSRRGWAYAEAFALWMAMFLAMSLVGDWIAHSNAINQSNSEQRATIVLVATMVIQIVCFIAALAWASFRVGTFRAVREDVGLHCGRGVVREVAAGALTYCMALPLLAIGFMITLALLAIQKMFVPEAPPPGHPVQEMLMNAGTLSIVLTLVLGAVVAPIVEETAFRGLFYRHLRDASASGGLVVSSLFSAGLSSLIFAMIHPQGWALIPALASLAVGLCIGREWRGSLIPGMVAHGISNFVMMSVSIMLFRG